MKKRTRSLCLASGNHIHVRNEYDLHIGDQVVSVCQCVKCGEMLSLGPADETSDPNVAIEIRAAEIAASGIGTRSIRNYHELDGWAHHYGRPMPPAVPIESPTTTRQLAGWLARQIAKGD